MPCRVCKDPSIISVSAKCGELIIIDELEGSDISKKYNIYEGDYIRFSYCGFCGTIQEGKWPIPFEEKRCEVCQGPLKDNHCTYCGAVQDNFTEDTY